jgi:CMP-N-acetylneuraminic acid synthetase
LGLIRLALIPARGGSKGLPRKNLCRVGGASLVARAVHAALESGAVDRVVVSTDCSETAEEALRAGAEVPFLRPAELATDTASPVDTALHALMWEAENRRPVDDLVLLQPTSPLRTGADVRQSRQALDEGAPAVVSVTECRTHPWLVASLDPDGSLIPVMPTPEGYVRRQDFPQVYQLNGAVYWIKSTVLISERKFTPKGTRAYVMPACRSIDIDTQDDLDLADWMLAREAPV